MQIHLHKPNEFRNVWGRNHNLITSCPFVSGSTQEGRARREKPENEPQCSLDPSLSEQGKAGVPDCEWQSRTAGWAGRCVLSLGARENAKVHSAPNMLPSSFRSCHPL